MISEYFAEKTVRIGRVRSLRRQISAEFRKATICFYENKVGPNLKKRPKFWWKHIKCLIGKKKTTVKATMLDPTTGLHIDDKQFVCYLNNFFANLYT